MGKRTQPSVGERKTMAILIPVTTDVETTKALVWKCSECETSFSLAQGHGSDPSPAALSAINLEFRDHCRIRHPNANVDLG